VLRKQATSAQGSQLPGCVSLSTASLRELREVAEAGDLNQVIQNSGEITKTKLHCVWLYEIQKLNLAAVFTIKRQLKFTGGIYPHFVKTIQNCSSPKKPQKAIKRDFLKLYKLCKDISDLSTQVKFVVLLNILVLLIMHYNSFITHAPSQLSSSLSHVQLHQVIIQ